VDNASKIHYRRGRDKVIFIWLVVIAGLFLLGKEFLDRWWPYPGFLTRWDRIPPPNVRGPHSMDCVADFVATYGWEMRGPDDPALFAALDSKMRPITGLPWSRLRKRRLLAITSGGILYVPLEGFGPESSGICYNPLTNHFLESINGFKPIGGHWYVWEQTSPTGEQKYE
jgi:hypothetical protein